eukprot:scaffold10667_cov132-Isochrysis_galbana.AAC.6
MSVYVPGTLWDDRRWGCADLDSAAVLSDHACYIVALLPLTPIRLGFVHDCSAPLASLDTDDTFRVSRSLVSLVGRLSCRANFARLHILGLPVDCCAGP